MSYQVLALKYRPQTFEDVVGQPHVTTTLANAIKSDRVAHSILFTGPRGTGKTTIARILAKALNCQEGASPVPCNACKICMDITQSHCSDVFEIDGASNNSVDQIRDLRENVTYMPSSAKFKIYIIDEVHMLSTAAFNALLKTLEEPPDHVMFIFATTEVHKIPATILSRCQRHDLGRISLTEIAGHLGRLCTTEGFELESKSLDLIAREADGSIRDSLSLLDRILSSSETSKVSHDAVLESLGVMDTQVMVDVSEAIFNRDGASVIQTLETINHSGMDLKKYYSDLILYFRNLSVLHICGKDSPNVNLSPSEKELLFNAISNLSGGYLNVILQHLLDNEQLVKHSSHTRTAIEMVLLKLIQIDPGEQIDQIILKLDQLARQISTGTPAQPPEKKEFHPEKQDQQQIDAPAAASPAQQSEEPAPPSLPQTEEERIQPPQTVPTSTDYQKNWTGFLQKIEAQFPYIAALLTKEQMVNETEDHILVQLNNCSNFDQKRIQSKQKELEKECNTFLNKKLTIQVAVQNGGLSSAKKKNEFKAKQAVLNHPFVVEAQKIFNGEIINQ